MELTMPTTTVSKPHSKAASSAQALTAHLGEDVAKAVPQIAESADGQIAAASIDDGDLKAKEKEAALSVIARLGLDD